MTTRIQIYSFTIYWTRFFIPILFLKRVFFADVNNVIERALGTEGHHTNNENITKINDFATRTILDIDVGRTVLKFHKDPKNNNDQLLSPEDRTKATKIIEKIALTYGMVNLDGMQFMKPSKNYGL